MEQLQSQHLRLLSNLDMRFHRSLMQDINWESRLIGIRGARGVGKTTMLLQHIKSAYGDNPQIALYASMDHLYFSNHSLLELAENFYSHGGKCLCLDEVHKYDGWSREIKNIYDGFPDLKIVFTGSSLLNILNAEADLSRRCVSYDMQGLSFREYLQFAENFELPVFTLEQIFLNPSEAVETVLKVCKPLKYFSHYLQNGYYPFFLEKNIDYLTQVQKVVNLILEIELPLLRNVEISNVRKLRSLLSVVSSGVPFAVDISKMAQTAELNRNTIVNYLTHLNRAKLLNLLYSDTTTIKRMQKPDKIYMENCNLLHALSLTQVEVGTERETFFVNQLAYQHQVEYAKQGDFLIDRKYTVEVGGQSKDGKQIAGVSNAYIAADNMEYALGNKIPLWLFGFLY
ncbi:MAG: ATP-binding protein [Bacteroidales bacterium]|nr:ATP-binding protein [Bacteroidales bacterium]MBP5722684.1 ATP-binding protein [Bacteroidales bacterium]